MIKISLSKTFEGELNYFSKKLVNPIFNLIGTNLTSEYIPIYALSHKCIYSINDEIIVHALEIPSYHPEKKSYKYILDDKVFSFINNCIFNRYYRNCQFYHKSSIDGFERFYFGPGVILEKIGPNNYKVLFLIMIPGQNLRDLLNVRIEIIDIENERIFVHKDLFSESTNAHKKLFRKLKSDFLNSFINSGVPMLVGQDPGVYEDFNEKFDSFEDYNKFNESLKNYL